MSVVARSVDTKRFFSRNSALTLGTGHPLQDGGGGGKKFYPYKRGGGGEVRNSFGHPD